MYNKIEKVEEQNNYCGVTAWHNAGFTGEGVHIWNCEDLSSHGEVSTRRIYDAAPGAITHNAVISVRRNREKIYYFYVTDENGTELAVNPCYLLKTIENKVLYYQYGV